MRRAVAAIGVCSLGALVAPMPHSLPAALAVLEKDAGDNLLNLAAAEYPGSGIPICTAAVPGINNGKHVAYNSRCESGRAGPSCMTFASKATRPAAAWVVAQASAAVAPASTSPSVAGEPLRAPPVCSSIEAGSSELQLPFCRVAPLPGGPGRHELTLSLTATTSPVQIGGYRLNTDNYDGTYLPPVVELKAGDSLNVRLLNALASNDGTNSPHGSAMPGHDDQSTNIHTHGLIVSPKNARNDPRNNGDNIFVSLGRGQSLDYSIQVPTRLPASLLDGKKGYFIPHPSGLYWYHSHLHGISAAQVGGGMAGILSIGARDANLVATKETETGALRARTDTSYLMLRDIQTTSTVDPTAADGQSPASRPPTDPDPALCQPGSDGVGVPPLEQRDGYCQSPKDKSRIWLFTVNGQRFPTIQIPSGRNKLLRLANLSASATYVISLRDPSGNAVPFDLISVDGVVPGSPQDASVQDHPEALKITTLLFMPASRAEIFIANDQGNASERQLVLRTDGKDTSAPGTGKGDPWPQINLATVILEGAPAAVAGAAPIGLNEYVGEAGPPPALLSNALAAAALPQGCVRDIDHSNLEHRRIKFAGQGPFTITTDLVHSPDKNKPQPYNKFVADPQASLSFIGFDKYLKPDHTVDWDATDGRPRHTCVRLANGHGQLWELNNPTDEMHNFHIHQTKFRSATDQDLTAYGIDPSSIPHPSALEIKTGAVPSGAGRDLWNDTIPMEAHSTILIVINFDAQEQLGRYVYHCHILEHEDNGLMAPMEVVR
jgi:FtsP/CotA-like multicopper oxidase with cupredoxin domain